MGRVAASSVTGCAEGTFENRAISIDIPLFLAFLRKADYSASGYLSFVSTASKRQAYVSVSG